MERWHGVHFAQHAFDVDAQNVTRIQQVLARRLLPEPGDIDREQVVLALPGTSAASGEQEYR